MSKKDENKNFAVLGLGRFGMSLVYTLAEYDVDILACDREEEKLQRVADFVTHVVKGQLSDERVLQKLGLGNFDVVIVAMGEDFEASLIATMVAKEQGAKKVIVKAQNMRQMKILKNIGADEVVLPEHEIGAKLARKLISRNIIDVLEESDYYTISEMYPMENWVGKTLSQLDIRRKHKMTILAIRRGKKMIIPVSPDQVLQQADILILLKQNKESSSL